MQSLATLVKTPRRYGTTSCFAIFIIWIACSGASSSKAEALVDRAWDATLFHIAKNYIDQALAQDPKCANAYCLKGWQYYREAEYPAAITNCTKGIALHPTQKRYLYTALYYRYHAYIKRDQWKEALDDCLKCLSMAHTADGTGDASLLYRNLNNASQSAQYKRLADSLLAKERKDYQSIPDRLLLKKTFLAGNSVQLVFTEQEVLDMQDPKKVDGVLAKVNAFIKKHPDNILAYEERIACYKTRGDSQKRLDDYTTLLKLSDRTWQWTLKRADLYWKMGRYKEAAIDFRALLKLRPGAYSSWISLDEVRNRLGICLQKCGDYDGAIANYTDMLKADPDSEEAFRYRGDCYVAQHHYDKAVEDYSKSISLDTESAGSTYLARAKAFENLGKPEQAKKDREQAKRLGYAKPPRGDVSFETLEEDGKALLRALPHSSDNAGKASKESQLVQPIPPNVHGTESWGSRSHSGD